jgi:hypothetical protein
MFKLLITFAAWVAGSYAVYRFLPSWCIVVYGIMSLVCFLIWAGTRKGSTIKRNA